MKVTTVGIGMPRDFPTRVYNDISARVGPLQPRYADAYRHYAGAWNALAIRFRSAAYADTAFRRELARTQTVLGRNREEEALFRFFGCLQSSLDSLGYGLHAIANIANATSFGLTAPELRAATPTNVATALSKAFPNEPIGPTLRSMLDEPTAVEIHELRNALTHRTATTRSIELSTLPYSGSSSRWQIDHLQLKTGLRALTIDAKATAHYRLWLAKKLQALLSAGLVFTKCLPP